MKKFDVLGLGNPLIDLIANVDDKCLENLDLVKDSMNLVDEKRQEEILDSLDTSKLHVDVGGSCGNTMVGVAQFGGKSAYCGKVGNDKLADNFENELVKLGVSSYLKRNDGKTGSTVILVTPDAARTMNTNLASCQMFSENDIDYASIEDSKYIYVEGYLWDTEVQKKAVMAAFDHAKKVGTKISLSLSDPFCVDRNKEDFTNLINNYVQLLFCNADEAMQMTDTKTPEEAGEILKEKVEHVVITMGKDGAKVWHKGQVFAVSSFEVNAVDTTGAGDSFAAGYLFGITNGYTEKKAGTLASLLASKVVSKIGPRFDGDIKKEAIDFL